MGLIEETAKVRTMSTPMDTDEERKPWIIGSDGTKYWTIDEYREHLDRKSLSDELGCDDKVCIALSMAVFCFFGLLAIATVAAVINAIVEAYR